MNSVSMFILLPESQPSNQWMQSNEPFLKEDELNRFVKELEEKIDVIKIEDYTGYYDTDNILNFLDNYEILEDYYPQPVKNRLYDMFLSNSFYDWNKEKTQTKTISYTLYGQKIENHTFCEIAHRQSIDAESRFILLNHYAHSLDGFIEISFNQYTYSISSYIQKQEIVDWFVINRIPARNFHIIDKHGENREEERLVNGKLVSPLRCSEQKARELLQTAIGDTKAELFNDDTKKGYYIIFRYEGNNPQNMYHGYHVSYTSNEVPKSIKERLQQ